MSDIQERPELLTAGEHSGRTALVFGGTSGIGRAAAMELARQGARVVVHGLDRSDAINTAAAIRALGGDAVAVFGYVEDERTSAGAVREAVAAFGQLDTVVASAGIQRYGDVVSTPEATWDHVFEVNVKGTFLALKHSLPLLRESANGSIVVVTSVQAFASQKQVAAYTASKGALVALVRSLAVDEADYGVRANSVSPGSVDTPMLRASAALLGTEDDTSVNNLIRHWGTSHALGRVAAAHEVAAAISFLASPRSSFITGIDLKVDGGLTAQLPVPISPQR